MERRALLAFVISIAILFGYQFFFETPRHHPAGPDDGAAHPAASAPAGQVKAPADQDTAPVEAPAPFAPEAAPKPAETKAKAPRFSTPERTITVETDLYTAVFSSWGGRLTSFKLKRYRVTADHDSPLLDMVDAEGSAPLALYWVGADGKVLSDATVVYELAADRKRVGGSQEAEVVLTGKGPNGEALRKRLKLTGDSYLLDLTVEVDTAADSPVGLAWAHNSAGSASSFRVVEGPVVLVDDKLHANAASKLKEAEPQRYRGNVSWAGYADHYFLAAFVPDEDGDHEFVASRSGDLGVATLWSPSDSTPLRFHVYVGPKGIHDLEKVGYHLDAAVDLGWFTFIARPLLELLLWMGAFTGNYGWAIIILTVGIKLVLYPVNRKQVDSMRAMQRIQPELKKIQERYKDDRDKLNQEMMELYRRHKVNPLSGCLPMVLQIPVFIGLYNALIQSIELRHAPFLGWITDLSQPDRLGSFAIPFVHPPGIPVLTLLMGVSMVVQQRMTPATGDPTQQRMMMFMPIIFTVMFVNFPAGLVIYWFANNVLSIAQQYISNRRNA